MFTPIQLNSVIQRLKPVAFCALRLTPFGLQKFVAEQLLNDLMREAIEEDDLDFLSGRVVSIRVLDAQINWHFSYQNERVRLLPDTVPADVMISGNSDAFVLLASGRADPDSLFFRRQLAIEGDTNLGLGVKNLLDSLDLSTLPVMVRKLLDRGGEIAELTPPVNAH